MCDATIDTDATATVHHIADYVVPALKLATATTKGRLCRSTQISPLLLFTAHAKAWSLPVESPYAHARVSRTEHLS